MHGFSSASRVLIVFAAFVIVVAGIRASEAIMVTFLLSGFFAIICAPPFLFLLHRGVPAWLSMVAVAVVIVLIQVLFLGIIATTVADFSSDLPVYQARIAEMTHHSLEALASVGIDIPQSKVMQYFDPAMVFKLAAKTLGNLGSVLSNSFLIILTVIFMLFEGVAIPAKIQLAFGKDNSHMAHIQRFLENVKQYMTIKTAISFLTGLFIYLWLLLIGVDYALLWGVVAFLFNFVPNIGSIIAAVPAVLLALIQPQLGPISALLAGLGYVVANMVMGNIVEPRYMGRGLGLSTLVVFLSLVFWGWVLGPVGMVLSVPLTMLLKIAFESSEDTRWLAVLMGAETIAEGIEESSTEGSTE